MNFKIIDKEGIDYSKISGDNNLIHLKNLEGYNSIFGEKTTLREWVELFCQINKLNLELIWGGKAYPPNQIFAPFHGETLPNWEQRISPEEGFSRFKL